MNVLHVTQGYFPAIGGTELLIQRVSEELVRQFGDQVTVFTTNCYSGDAFYTPSLPRMPLGEEVINGVCVRRFPVLSRLSRLFYPFRPSLKPQRFPGDQYFRLLYNGPIIPGLDPAIRQHPAEITAASSFPLLHMHVALRAAHGTSRPCVLHGGLHPEDAWGFQRPMIYALIRQADGYIANTGFEADYVIDRGADPQRVTTIGVGVDLEPFERTSQAEARQRLGIEPGPLVGFIGQLGAHKGVDTLVRAMPLVWQVVPEARLMLAGARTLYAAQLEADLARLSPQERQKVILRYDFPAEEKPWLFAATDVFAYPSGFESFGIAFLEAWAVKKPVVGCRRGAIPWVVSAGKDGLLVPFQDETMLAAALASLLKNPGYARSLGEAGYRKVLARYTWPQVARRFREVYAAALAERRGI